MIEKLQFQKQLKIIKFRNSSFRQGIENYQIINKEDHHIQILKQF